MKMDLAMIIKYDFYKDNYIKARSRGAKIRFVTEDSQKIISIIVKN